MFGTIYNVVGGDRCLIEYTSPAALEDLRPEWSRLWVRCRKATPFQSPDWLLPWWKHLGEGQLMILGLHCGGELVGIAPFLIHARRDGDRQLLLLGTGASDYLDVLFERESEEWGMRSVMEHLQEHYDRWDLCDWQQLVPDSPLLRTSFRANWLGEITPQEVCPVLTLPKRVEDLPLHVPRRQLERFRYYKSRLARVGTLEMLAANSDNFEELFEGLLRLHRARWSARGAPGMLKDQAIQKFHREAAEALLAQGLLRLYALRLDDHVIAALYGFLRANHAYYYLSGFDPAFERFSPGMILIGHAIEEAVGEGAEDFDFLRGPEPYKYQWGAKDRLTYRRCFRSEFLHPAVTLRAVREF